MFPLNNRKFTSAFLTFALAFSMLFTPASRITAADHGDAPTSAMDRATDLADIYAFLDPNNNSRVVLIMTIGGFITPGENGNFGIFDPALRYRFEIEQTGDARPDRFIDVRFSRRVANASGPQPQIATVTLPNGRTFTASATNPSATASTPPPPIITTDTASDVQFFAGITDDPFFFDIPGFNRFLGSVRSGNIDPSLLQRGRDSFEGYNITSIALSLPADLLRGTSNEIGVAVSTQRRMHEVFNERTNQISSFGRFVNIDRTGVPGVNVALVPFNQKDEYNAATTLDDAAFRFANGIVGVLRGLGTSQANIDILAGIAVVRGDILRLNLSLANTGPGGGTNAAAAFPNGRRLRDDVIDTIITVVTNGAITSGDNAHSVDPFTNTFPFIAPPIQPFPPGTTDDRTRN